MVLSGFKQNIGNPWHSITKVPPDILFWLQIDSEYSTLQAHSIYWEQMGAKISSWIFFNITGETNKIGFGMLPGVADFLSELNSLNSGQWNIKDNIQGGSKVIIDQTKPFLFPIL